LHPVRRPGSPITGLKLKCGKALTTQNRQGQKAWKPDYGIETAPSFLLGLLFLAGQKAWKPDYGIETYE